MKLLNSEYRLGAGFPMAINAGDLDIVYPSGETSDAHMRAVVDPYWDGQQFNIDMLQDENTVVDDANYAPQQYSDWANDEERGALSQLTLSTVMFVPAFVGLAIACTVALDVRNFVLIPASLSLVLCVAAILYQAQGWITSAMGTKRHRVLIGYLVFTVMIAVTQASYVVYLTRQVASEPEATEATATSSDPRYEGVRVEEADQATREETGLSRELLSLGWVTRGSADGHDRFPWLPVVAMIGLLALAMLSLRRSYRATVARYRHGQTGIARPQAGVEQRGRRVPV